MTSKFLRDRIVISYADQFKPRKRKKCALCGKVRLTTVTNIGGLCNDCLTGK